MTTPLVSVVMPSFQQVAFLPTAMRSVLTQDYDRLELIVADGGSTDGSADILADAARADPRVRWWSEPDGGPAPAINRAMDAARGTLIGWLNSDDLYAPGAIRRATSVLSGPGGPLIAYGHGDHVDRDGAPLGAYPTVPPPVPPPTFSAGCFICQPTVFFRTACRALLGPLDEGLRASFDYDYWLRAFAAFPDRIGFVDAHQASSRLHDDCITQRFRRRVATEGMIVTKRHLGAASPHWLTTYLEESANARGEGTRAEVAAALADAERLLAPDQLAPLRARATALFGLPRPVGAPGEDRP